YRTDENGVRDGCGDFRFAAAGNGAGFVAKNSPRTNADEAPGAIGRGLFHPHAITRWSHVGVFGQHLDVLFLSTRFPRDGLRAQVKQSGVPDVNDIAIFFIDRVPFGPDIDEIAVEPANFLVSMAFAFDVN